MEVSKFSPAIFLDRDGVIIENRSDYVTHWDKVEILPLAFEAISLLKNSPYQIIIVTNQSAIGRGLMTFAMANEINKRLVSLITSSGGRIDGVYICPHTPSDNCVCRKPRSGLLFNAAKELKINLSKSVMVGDALTDIEAGQQAGVRSNVLVRTGRGSVQAQLPAAKKLRPFLTLPDLFQTAKHFLAID